MTQRPGQRSDGTGEAAAHEHTHQSDVARRRTPAERSAYIDGFGAGVDAALQEVARLNFSDAAERARPNVAITLELLRNVEENQEQGRG